MTDPIETGELVRRLERAERQRDKLAEALRKAHHELNIIRARDGVPYCYGGIKSDVDETYFSNVVDEARAALAQLETP